MANTLLRSETRKKLLLVYCLGLTAPFLSNLALLSRDDSVYYLLGVFQALGITGMTACAVLLWLDRKNRFKGIPLPFYVLFAAFFWIIFRFLIEPSLLLEFDPQPLWFRAFAAWFLFFPVGFLLDGKELKKPLLYIGSIWITAMTILAAAGIYCAATGNNILLFPESNRIGVMNYDGFPRLWLAKYPTDCADDLLVAFGFAMTGLFITRKRWVKGCLLGAMAVMFTALGLVDGRAVMLSLGGMAAVAVFIIVIRRGVTKKTLAVGVVAAVAVIFAINFTCTRVGLFFPEKSGRTIEVIKGPQEPDFYGEWDWFPEDEPSEMNAAPEQRAYVVQPLAAFTPAESSAPIHLVPLASVQEETETSSSQAVTHREFEMTFAGRTFLWKAALDTLRSNENNILLLGRTPYDYLTLLYKNGFPYPFTHCHNVYMQTVLEWGIPGLVLMVLFLVLFAVSALRLILNCALPFWQRFLPVPAMALLAAELADCFSLLEMDFVSLHVIFLFMGMTMGLDYRLRNKSEC